MRVQTLRMRNTDGGRASVEDLHRVNGVVRDTDGAPVPEAWVVMVGGPGWVVAEDDGRFAIGPVRPGVHHLRARAPDGREGEAEVKVPGPLTDLVVGGDAPRKRSRGRS